MESTDGYPYDILHTWEGMPAAGLKPGAVVIDSEGDVLHLRLTYEGPRWFAVGVGLAYMHPSVPAIVLVSGWGPEDYPDNWEELGGEPR